MDLGLLSIWVSADFAATLLGVSWETKGESLFSQQAFGGGDVQYRQVVVSNWAQEVAELSGLSVC